MFGVILTDTSSPPIGQIWEGGHRIPLMMRWDGNPSFPSNETRSNLVGLNDLFATLVEFAGLEVPINQAMDSVSSVEHILNKHNKDGLRDYLGTNCY